MPNLLHFPDRFAELKLKKLAGTETLSEFLPADHAEIEQWMAPRRPWGFREEFTALEVGCASVFLVFAPGRHDSYAFMVSKVDNRISVTDDDGWNAQAFDMADALTFMAGEFCRAGGN